MSSGSSTNRSIRELPPLEAGGVIARKGMDLQDHVAAGYGIDMLSPDTLLEEVWCERQDDITLLWSGGKVEFVQVKSTDKDWTVAALGARPEGNKPSILERSLANDRAAEVCCFRIVTARDVAEGLRVLKYPAQGYYRLGSEGRVKLDELEKQLEPKVRGARSPNGNGLRFWLDNTEWEVIQSITAVENKNLLKLAAAFERSGPAAPSRWIRVVYGEILDQVFAASIADWKTAKHSILRTQLLAWFDEKCQGTPRTSVPLWDIPAPTETFRERPDIMEKIDAALATGKIMALTALKGMPGVGKSQMARYFAHLRRQHYDAGIWIASETENAILAGLGALASQLGVTPQPDPKVTAGQVIEQFCQLHGKWLVVFDDAPEVATMRPFAQKFHGDGHLLITSRSERWDGVVKTPVSITSWSIPEATAFLLDRLELGEESKADAEALAKELGGLILALEHAAAYLASGDGSVTLVGYGRMWRGRLAKLPPGGPHEYSTAVEATILLSLDVVRAKSGDAWELLRLFAWLDPDFIPKIDLLEAGKAALPERLRLAVPDVDRWTELMEALRAHSLIGFEHRDGRLGYTVHRVVQEVLQGQDVEGEGWREARRVLDAAFPADAHSNVGCWPLCWLLLPHARVLREWLRAGRVSSDEYLPLWNKVAMFLQPQGFFLEALDLEKLSLGEAVELLHPEHAELATNRSSMAITLTDLGENEKAREQIELALESDLRQFGPDDSTVAVRREILAIILNNLREPEKAREQIELALESNLRRFVPDDPTVAANRSYLAVILRSLAEPEKALEQIELALESALRQFAPDHPNVAVSRSNLAIILRSLGEYEKARGQIELALESVLRQFAPDHPNVGVRHVNLAGILYDLRDFEGAWVQINMAIANYEKSLPAGHPRTEAAFAWRDFIACSRTKVIRNPRRR